MGKLTCTAEERAEIAAFGGGFTTTEPVARLFCAAHASQKHPGLTFEEREGRWVVLDPTDRLVADHEGRVWIAKGLWSTMFEVAA